MFLDILTDIFVFVLGICIGSFLNCVIYRLEQKKSLNGRSFCPHCKHNLNWMDLFPVLSFLFLGGKCRYCKKKISWQYPMVEIFTGLIFLLIFVSVIPSLTGNPESVHLSWIPAFAGMTIYLFFLFYVASALIIIFVYDLKHFLIPDKVLFPAIIISLIYRLFFNFSILNYLYGVLAAFGFFYALFAISKGKWMGFGDVKLAILMGLLLGFSNVLAALFLAFFFGAIISLILIAFYRKKIKSEVPFGPFLITGTFIALFYGIQIVQWYTHFFIN